MSRPQATHPQAHAGLSRHAITPRARQQRGVAVRHGPASSSLNPEPATAGENRHIGPRSVSKGNLVYT